MAKMLSTVVTSVRVTPYDGPGSVKAIVSITLNNFIVIHDIRVVQTENGLIVAMPSRKSSTDGNDKFRDIVHPIDSSARGVIERAILSVYNSQYDQDDAKRA